MPFTIQWYDKTTLLITCINSLGLDQLEKTLHTITAMTPIPTHLILDTSKAHGDPYIWHYAIKQLVKLTPNFPRKIAVIDIDPVITFWTNTMIQEQEHPYITSTSIEEAARLLHLMDAQAK